VLAASGWSIERKLLIAQTLSDVGNPRNYRAALERVGAQPLIWDNVPSNQAMARRDVTAARRATAPSQSPISPCASAQKHAAAQVWLLL
jgi:hypothetical protein